MPDQKISQLTNYTTPIATDVVPIVDITNSITKKIPVSNLSAPRVATYVVASSQAQEKTHADYVCTGSGDQVPIQAAINALSGHGGLIQLSEGDFVTNATITLPSNVFIRGMGRRATRIFKATGGYPGISILGAAGNNMQKSGLYDLGVEGNGQTGGCLLIKYAQIIMINNCSFDGNITDTTIEITNSQDSYFSQVTANTNHSTTNPVILIQGAASGNSNMIWFDQCRIEDFWNGAVWLQQGAGYSGTNNGFYFTQCKFESTQVGGDIVVADSSIQDIHFWQIFSSATGFKSGYSTAVNLFNTAARTLVSLRGVFFNAASTIGNSLAKIVVADGNCTLDDLIFNGNPVTSAIIFNGASGGIFNIGAISTNAGTLISGDASGISTLNAPTQLKGNVGFYNTAPIAQQVLATGSGHSVDNVITALQNLGLVKQS